MILPNHSFQPAIGRARSSYTVISITVQNIVVATAHSYSTARVSKGVALGKALLADARGNYCEGGSDFGGFAGVVRTFAECDWFLPKPPV